jgi:hypothetical protein
MPVARGRRALAPLALLLAVLLATAGAVALELLLFRGLFDLSAQLAGPAQQAWPRWPRCWPSWPAGLVEVADRTRALRLGRHLETRLRLALLHKLPRLHDRYFQSRPISDMADRSHGIQVARGVPQLALQTVQSLLELVLTVAGVPGWRRPVPRWALALAAVAVAVPLLAQPVLAERDLRVRTHAAALNGFYLDALLGLVPVRAHRAERPWPRARRRCWWSGPGTMRGWIVASLADGRRAGRAVHGPGRLAACSSHFRSQGGVGGTDLLLCSGR